VSENNNDPSEAQPRSQTDEARLAEQTARLRAALEGLDRGRAAYIVLSSLIGDELDRELVVSNPDTGRSYAFLLPPAERHCLHAAARPPHPTVLGDPPLTLEDVLRRHGISKDPVPAAIGEGRS
jgi:hypothetical protein